MFVIVNFHEKLISHKTYKDAFFKLFFIVESEYDHDISPKSSGKA